MCASEEETAINHFPYVSSCAVLKGGLEEVRGETNIHVCVETVITETLVEHPQTHKIIPTAGYDSWNYHSHPSGFFFFYHKNYKSKKAHEYLVGPSLSMAHTSCSIIYFIFYFFGLAYTRSQHLFPSSFINF